MTSNSSKAREIAEVLAEYGINTIRTDVETLEIQADDLAPIATEKARSVGALVREPYCVEEAGLFIEALSGFPGPYSSYVHETLGFEGILKLMRDEENRRAFFLSVAVLISDGESKNFVGRTVGKISTHARGERGFGFDPIFLTEGTGGRTFAELSLHEKNRFSHRGSAFRSLGSFLASP
ncbi:MAG: RdgB/HAM1 family non-canonical purine NTP pyrophosphatase [Candidatus Geothermarchaeales archaeon]